MADRGQEYDGEKEKAISTTTATATATSQGSSRSRLEAQKSLLMANLLENHHQPRRMEDTTTESSYQYYDPEGEMSEDNLDFAIPEDMAEDMAEDRQDEEEEEEDEQPRQSTPLAKVTPRSISRRSTEVSDSTPHSIRRQLSMDSNYTLLHRSAVIRMSNYFPLH
jgi:hypothetical protein